MLSPDSVVRYLVADPKAGAPASFNRIHEKILGGLPHLIRLSADFTLVVIVPTGLGITWRDIDPSTLVSSDSDVVPNDAPADESHVRFTAENIELGAVSRSPARIIVRRRRAIVASIPLVLGLRRVVPEGNERESIGHIELMMLGWEIYAGSLRGAGDFGSRISLAWRQADKGVSDFSPKPISPHVIPRLEPAARMEPVSSMEGEF